MNPTTFATSQITEHAIVMRRTMNNALSAAHIVLRCQIVGYLLMDGDSREVAQSIRLIPPGGPLLIVVLVFSIFSASNLFSGVNPIAFCQKSSACGMRLSLA